MARDKDQITHAVWKQKDSAEKVRDQEQDLVHHWNELFICLFDRPHRSIVHKDSGYLTGACYVCR